MYSAASRVSSCLANDNHEPRNQPAAALWALVVAPALLKTPSLAAICALFGTPCKGSLSVCVIRVS